MVINKRILWAAAVMGLLCRFPLQAMTYTVAQDGSGNFRTIQEAVNRTVPGDVIEIMDVATYKEQVTIDSTHSNIILMSSVPTALNKPKIVWQDIVDVGPRNYAESQKDSLITFDRNGALRILGAKNVTINGIAVDGGGPYVFGYPNVWNNTSDLVHGNAAITIWVSGGAHVINCDLSNAYFGINFKDRNQGGIFANANPADLQPQNIVPMSGFGRTGNHVVEYNRIHNNSYGMFFESAWDLGNTIRYNLFYENHHQTDAFAAKVKALTPQEGANQPGGALFFKDVAYSPLSIYNNTFWHNFLIFVGGWRAGCQHLVFNNIYAKPVHYWQADATFSNNAYMDLSPFLPNRMNNCIYSCQIQAPQTSYVSIMNGLPQPATTTQGALLSTTTANAPFPAAANIRWIEMDSTRFNSMDPATLNFLEPKWTDALVASYIKNQGWQKSGVKNMDGSWADIGAVSSDGARPTDFATIFPTDPVDIQGMKATIEFALDQRVGTITNPAVKFFRFVSNLPTLTPTEWSGLPADIITVANINDVTFPAAPPVHAGLGNTYTVTIPVAQTTDYAFFEAIIEGTDSKGKQYTTSTGFCPYRLLDYRFIVEIWNSANTRRIDTAHVGDTVILKVTPQKKDGTSFANTIIPVEAHLQSPNATLWNTAVNPMAPLTYPAGITGPTNRQVMFTIVPTGGIEEVSVNGIWRSSSDTIYFRGKAFIHLLPGPAASVVFQNPPSVKFGISPAPTLPQGTQYPGTLFVYDKYGNKTWTPASVTLSSLTPALGNFVGTSPVVITTDSTGTGRFSVTAVSGASTGSLVKLQALLAATGNLDTAYMTVGPPIGKLFIFYYDTLAYNPRDSLQGQVGDRLKVTIISTKSANPTIDSIVVVPNTSFSVSGSPGLVFYDSPTATIQSSSFTLVNGRVTVWVSSADTISNGSITLSGATTVDNGSPRDNIYFTRPAVAVDSAFYYSRTGFGMVDSIDIYYKAKLSMIPDSITLFWPAADSGKRVVAGTSSQMRLAADSVHLTIVLTAPFAPEITAATTTDKQGISYNRPNNNPGVPESASPFAIKDRVGPLLMSAQVVERLTPGPGVDTLYVSFSEPINPASAAGDALVLIKNGTQSDLVIASASAVGTGGTRYKLVVSGTAAPQLGDSLKIKSPGGTILDAQNNYAHPQNRPVVITQKSIPATITGALYQDRDGDGVVDHVVIDFVKKVSPADLIVSLDWGGSCRADSIPAARISAIDSSSIEINVRGAFATLSADSIKTSGAMRATVSSVSMPDEAPVGGNVTDGAAPVLISAKYFPGSMLDEKTTAPDTVFVQFSEDISSLGPTASPFSLFNTNSGTPYTLVVNSGDALLFTNKSSGRIVVNSVSGIQFPMKGDSMWINPAAGVADMNSAVQANPLNHRVVLDVQPISPSKIVSVSQNPFTIGKAPPVPGVSRQGLVIQVKPLTNMLDYIKNLSASGKIYDGLGNLIVDETDFKRNPLDNSLYLIWDGRNRNDRYVGTGTYLAVFSVKDQYGVVNNYKKKIGVIR